MGCDVLSGNRAWRAVLPTVASVAGLAVVACLTLAAGAAAASTPSVRTSLTQQARAVLAETRIAEPARGAVTRLEALEGVEAVAGIAPVVDATATFSDVPPSSPAFAAVQAAVEAGLLRGWASIGGAFRPNAPIARVQLAVLATNALGLVAQANALETDESLYSPLRDLYRTGYDLGFANLMLKYGIVPPESAHAYAPEASLSGGALALTLVRMWAALDVPRSISVAVADDTLTGASNPLSVTMLNRLGTPVPVANAALYRPTYTSSGPGGASKLTGGAFLGSLPGPYTIAVAVHGPLMPTTLTARATIVVTPRPVPLRAPADVTATAVAEGIQVTWSPGAAEQNYQVLETEGTDEAYTAVAVANGGQVGPGATATLITGLTPGDAYAFEVESVAANGASESSPPSTAVLYEFTAPAALTATEVLGGVDLAWTPGTGETGYTICDAPSSSAVCQAVPAADGGGSLPASADSATVTGLVPGALYSFDVAAVDARVSPAVTLSAPAATIRYGLAPPINVTATAVGTSIEVAWAPVPSAVTYEVFEAESGDSSYAAVASSDGGSTTTTTTTIAAGTPGDTYTFEVEAVDADGNASGLSAPSAAAVYPLAPTTEVTATEVAGGIQVTWGVVSGAATYELYEQEGGGGAFSPVSAADGGVVVAAVVTNAEGCQLPVNSSTVTGLTPEETYAFEVEATGRSDESSALSPPSNTAPFGSAVSGTFQPTAATVATGAITLGAVSTTTADATGTIEIDNSPTNTGPTTPGSSCGGSEDSTVSSGGGSRSPPYPFGVSVNGNVGFVGQLGVLGASSGSGPQILSGIGSAFQKAVVNVCASCATVSYSVSQDASGNTFLTLSYPGAFGNTICADGLLGAVWLFEIGMPNQCLSGGQSPDAVTVGSTTFTAVASSPTGDEYSSNATLANAINAANLGITATSVGAESVDLVADEPGTAYDLALTDNNPADISLSGSAMSILPTTVTLTFTAPVDTSTLNANNFGSVLTLPSGVTFGSGATAAWNPNDTTFTIACGSGENLAVGDTIGIPTSVTDADGNPVSSSVTLATGG